MAESIYKKLAERIDMYITGAPKVDGDFSPAFLKYLELLYTPEEAELASLLSVPPKRMTAEELAVKAGKSVDEVERLLGEMTNKGVIVGFGGQYMLPVVPLLVNYHPFRNTDDEDTLKAGRLYQQFFIEDGFYRFYESSANGTPGRRAVPVDQSISSGQQVLTHEDIHAFLDSANMGALALAPCPCRNRTEKLGIRECTDRFPVGSCLFVGLPAMLMVGRGDGREIDRAEAERFVDEMRDLGLITMTDNAVEMKDGVICFCCGCCCSVARGLTRWDNPRALAKSNFVAQVGEDCAACGTCVDRCMLGAISLNEGAEKAQVDENRCIGCGVCTVTCPTEALRLERAEREPIFPNARELHSTVAFENEAAGQKRPLE